MTPIPLNDDFGFTPDLLAALKHREAHDCSLVELPAMEFWNVSDSKKTPEQKAHIIDRAQTLAHGLRLPYEEKVLHAIKVINYSLKRRVRWAVSYSGGRDSHVLSHLMTHRMGLTGIPHVMSNTRMEYTESIRQVTEWYATLRAMGVSCHVVFPAERPKTLWKRIGVPLWSKELAYKYRKFSHSPSDNIPSHVPDGFHDAFRKLKAAKLKVTEKCCSALKKEPMKAWDIIHGIGGHFTGMRSDESRARRLMWIMKGALYRADTHDMWMCNPLSFWTGSDVQRYLQENGLHVHKPDTAQGGSGCVTCMFGCASRAAAGEKNAMQDLKVRNPKMWLEALDEWGYREVLDLLEIPYE